MVPMATALVWGSTWPPLGCFHRNSSLPSLHITLDQTSNISLSLFLCFYLCIFLYLPFFLSSLIHTLASD